MPDAIVDGVDGVDRMYERAVGVWLHRKRCLLLIVSFSSSLSLSLSRCWSQTSGRGVSALIIYSVSWRLSMLGVGEVCREREAVV